MIKLANKSTGGEVVLKLESVPDRNLAEIIFVEVYIEKQYILIITRLKRLDTEHLPS